MAAAKIAREGSLPFVPHDDPHWRPELAVRRNAYRCVSPSLPSCRCV